jgi:hypothetical protein
MIPCTQEATSRRTTVARPRTGEMPIQHVRAPDDDWADLDTASDGKRPEVVRELIRWYLRRPGSRLPERPPAADWPAVRAAAVLEWFASLGHDVDADAAEFDEDGRRLWRCRNCGGHASVSAKGKAVSPSGTASCPGRPSQSAG